MRMAVSPYWRELKRAYQREPGAKIPRVPRATHAANTGERRSQSKASRQTSGDTQTADTPDSAATKEQEFRLPQVQIRIDEDNQVHRPDVPFVNLAWVIKRNGERVLTRNANGELKFRYFGKKSGLYEVYLGRLSKRTRQYERISNVVSYEIE